MSRTRRAGFAAAALIVAACLVALGVWQLERRAWKHELITAVETRTHADPVAAPGIGQHTAEVLQQVLGYDEMKIARLAQDGVVDSKVAPSPVAVSG